MIQNLPSKTGRKAGTDLPITIGMAVMLLFFFTSGYLSYHNTKTLSRDALAVTHTHEVISSLGTLLSLIKDAETGQRGYVITGNEIYLDPYKQAMASIDVQLERITELTADNAEQQTHLAAIRLHTRAKFSELQQTVDLRRTEGFDAAKEVVETDRGKARMDLLRAEISKMQDVEQDLRRSRFNEMERAYELAISLGIFAAVIGAGLVLAVGQLLRRGNAARRRQEWLQTGEVGMGNAMVGDLRVAQLGENILSFLAHYFDAHAAAFFVKDGSNFRRVAHYGVPEGSDTPTSFGMEDGLLGQAAKDGKPVIIREVPKGYLSLGSALGKGMPRHLVIAPAMADGTANAVLELGFVHPVSELALELLSRASEMIAVAVQAANYRAHLQNLLEETQRQAEELQAQGEELRVNNEELEEQSRALKESQARLEQQQAEMEQTNAQLEEQTQLLETQRDDLAAAKSVVQAKAQELERASQYKSDFLANMSHELRTPLNSSLILSKLLADNPKGNLTEEQVKFAATIQSSGNDLLALINDILDLSKIEAGHMDVQVEAVRLEQMAKALTRMFEPMAKQKGLAFSVELAKNAPHVETDRLRLEQVLKNLLSNAVKFTEKGSVTLAIKGEPGGRISFAVRDTGIGIAPEQRQAIFEAFRQADGTISRKYGGTGLGLSISRELARLLGGTIELSSKENEGSLFTLILPETYDAESVAPRATVLENSLSSEIKPAETKKARRIEPRVPDDRERLNGDKRVILVIEDDASFAQILYDLAQQLDFHCLIAGSAEEALAVAQQFMPSAVILDVGLPDHSGLTVLDRLKHDARTRHIPVHVISAGDYIQTALALGAMGYMLKPVKREQLIDTLKSFESKLAQRMRRVLIVEDDKTQRESMRQLLGTQDVETVAVGTAADCLKKLKENTFDCMVLDLSLPDATGFSLLETLSREDAYSFPPVIVYTGRELSADEEQKLRRYSKSIIIKGAKSPERLLDEVTLFLHQVVSELPPEQQRMLQKSMSRDAALEGRHILVVEDDVRNVYALTNILEPRGALVHIARNGREALAMLEKHKVDLVLMDVMMPEMDGMTATREIRKRPEWGKLPVLMLTAKAMRDDQERCLAAGANDYMAKPLDVEKLLSLVRVWMPR